MPLKLLVCAVAGLVVGCAGCDHGAAGTHDAGEAGGSVGNGGRAGGGGGTDTGDAAASGGVVGQGGVPGSGVATTDGSNASSWWTPPVGTTWQWQIGGGTFDTTIAAQAFDIDWEQNATAVQSLHAAGKKVICYVSVGSWEDWRSDAADFPAAVIGKDYPGWPGEKFVDIRSDVLRSIIAKRLGICQANGFDAVEPDNMDVFEASSGFPLTRADGVDYALWLAAECHRRGMAIVQKNAASIVGSIHTSYDGALTEDCYSGGWCSNMQPYIDANQPVFACEYDSSVFSAACAWGVPRKYSFILKKQDLGAWMNVCP
jgi:hypothetical protein